MAFAFLPPSPLQALIRKRSALVWAALLAAAVLFFFGLWWRNAAAPPAAEVAAAPRRVEIFSIDEGTASRGEIIATGVVRAQREARLVAQKSGRAVRVYAQAGAHVSAGSVIGEIENDAERAALSQATAALGAKQAALEKAQAGARAETRVRALADLEAATRAYALSREGAVNAFSAAFAAAENAVRGTADDLFQAPRTVAPRLIPASARYEEAVALEHERAALETVLLAWEEETRTLRAESDIDAALVRGIGRTRRVKSFLDSLANVASEQEPFATLTQEDIAAQVAALSTARGAADAALTSLVNAQSALAAARGKLKSRRAQVQEIENGARSEDLAALSAEVRRAEAGVEAARAAWEKTLLRSPLNGTLTTLTISHGGYLRNGELAAVVSDARALLVEVSLGTRALAAAVPSASVTLKGIPDAGIVVARDAGMNPTTKTARVQIAVADEMEPRFTVGEVVEVRIENKRTRQEPDGTRWVPLTAVRVTAEGYALGVVRQGKVVLIPAEAGQVRGALIAMRPLEPVRDPLIKDLRGLREGEAVVVEGT